MEGAPTDMLINWIIRPQRSAYPSDIAKSRIVKIDEKNYNMNFFSIKNKNG